MGSFQDTINTKTLYSYAVGVLLIVKEIRLKNTNTYLDNIQKELIFIIADFKMKGQVLK